MCLLKIISLHKRNRMKNPLLIILFLFFLIGDVNGQNLSEKKIKISGVILDSTSRKPLPFATIFVKKTNHAAISNYDGFFEFLVNPNVDSLFISYVGYKTIAVELNKREEAITVLMKSSFISLKEVIVRPTNNDALFELIFQCKSNSSNEIIPSKAYYQLKTYSNGKQIEVVENYYNSKVKGYNLLELQYKTGRVGIREFDNNYFASLETSKPIIRHNLFAKVRWFPLNPLQLNYKKLKKKFNIELIKNYTNRGDTLVELLLYPKKNNNEQFSVKLWINKSKAHIVQVEFLGKNLRKFPLEPFFDGDKLTDKNLKITKTFKEINKKMYLDQVYFNYDFNYFKRNKTKSHLQTNVFLQIYNLNEKFELPQFQFNNKKTSDYNKIATLPYNSDFWERNNELKLASEIDSNAIFLQSVNTLSNLNSNLNNNKNLTSLFNYPVSQWSTDRLFFKQLKQNTPYKRDQDQFNLAGKLYLEIDEFDSLHISTAAIFDDYESYYLYKIDTTSLCFINMYFDLVELNRRDLIQTLGSSSISKKFIYEKYEESKAKMEAQKLEFFQDTELGRNVLGMKKWNKLILQRLEIDNLKIYKLYP